MELNLGMMNEMCRLEVETPSTRMKKKGVSGPQRHSHKVVDLSHVTI